MTDIDKEVVMTVTDPEISAEQVAQAREIERTIRAEASLLVENAIETFIAEPFNLTREAASREIALQAITRSILLFGMLAPETQEIIKHAPLIVTPLPPEVEDVAGV